MAAVKAGWVSVEYPTVVHHVEETLIEIRGNRGSSLLVLLLCSDICYALDFIVA